MLRSFVLIAISFFLIGQINTLTAQPPNTPWPEWVFHHWVWEDESTQESAIALVDDYFAHDIPVGAIIIDSPWETGYNTFDWDTSLFPDAQAMIDYFHSKNVRVLMWITTALNYDTLNAGHDPVRDSLYAYAALQGYFMQKNANSGAAKIKWWKGWGSMIDFFNPDAVAWWKKLMDKALDMGIDGWKCDGTDYSVLLGNALYSPGAGRSVDRLEYSHAYYNLFHNYTRQRLGDDRVNMSRPIDNYKFGIGGDIAAFTPKDIGWACWVGDQDATFTGLTYALNNMYHSDDYGYLIFGSDIGGYRENDTFPPQMRSKELFVRWAQLGAFSPLMENGGGGEHRPWMFDQQTTDIYRTFTNLHYALIPYFMVQSDSLFNAGESLMQFFNADEYPFMLGSDIFVTPVLSSSHEVLIQFPVGNESWVYLFDNALVYQSGTSDTLNVPLDEYPVFLKASSPLVELLDSVINRPTAITTLSGPEQVIKIYPNPAKEEFRVSGFEFKSGEVYQVRIYNLLGNKVLSSQVNNKQMSINVTSLESGVYFYSVNSLIDPDLLRTTGKLVIQ